MNIKYVTNDEWSADMKLQGRLELVSTHYYRSIDRLLHNHHLPRILCQTQSTGNPEKIRIGEFWNLLK